MTEVPTKLPSSPAARAFFAALDLDPASQTVNTSSSFIKKRVSTLGWRNRFSQEESYPITVGSCPFSVTQVQRGEIDGTYGTGATVWPAAVVMIKYLERQKQLISDKLVVDLGSGTGITSIAAALLGARHVICTDGELSVVELASDNIQSAKTQLETVDGKVNASPAVATGNRCRIHECTLDIQQFWWGRDTIDDNLGHVDVVLVADCVLPKLYPIAPLVDAINQLLLSPGSFALVSYEHRHYPEYDPRLKFRELCAAKNLRVCVVPMEEQDPVYSVDDIELWRVERHALLDASG